MTALLNKTQTKTNNVQHFTVYLQHLLYIAAGIQFSANKASLEPVWRLQSLET
jgi:hypothetical protein